MSLARWIVDPLGFNGTHTTIGAAITSATSGDTIFIMDGTYTENITLIAGVNLTSFGASGIDFVNAPKVIINGTVTASYSGSVTIDGIQFQTNGATAALTITGSSTTILECIECQFAPLANAAITVNNSSSSLLLNNCTCQTGENFPLFTVTTTGGFTIFGGRYTNIGTSLSTASTTAAGTVTFQNTIFSMPIATSSTGTFTGFSTQFADGGNNITPVVLAGSGISNFIQCDFSANAINANPALTIGTGTTAICLNSSFTSANTNAISGAGTLNYANICFYGTSSQIGTTTVVRLDTDTTFSNSYTALTTGTYTVIGTDFFISCDSSGGAITIKLPNAPRKNRIYTIKDRTGSAVAHNISVTTVGGAVTIDGSTTYTMAVNYQSIQVLFNGTSYEVF